MASNKLDHPDLAHSSIKIEGLAGERLGPGYTRELSQEMIHRNGLQLQDRHVPEPMVKLEKGTSPDEVESKSLRTRISVTESRPFPGEENIGSFKMLEKGLIYFFYRSRVDIISAGGISDVARSFIVLRPTPSEATAGTMELGRKFRLLVVPKKIFPTSGRIKEIAFVEKAGITLKELQNIFLTGGESMKPRHTAQEP